MTVDKIYFDMDGVLADFDRGVKELCGFVPQSQNDKNRSVEEDDLSRNTAADQAAFFDKGSHHSRGSME